MVPFGSYILIRVVRISNLFFTIENYEKTRNIYIKWKINLIINNNFYFPNESSRNNEIKFLLYVVAAILTFCTGKNISCYNCVLHCAPYTSIFSVLFYSHFKAYGQSLRFVCLRKEKIKRNKSVRRLVWSRRSLLKRNNFSQVRLFYELRDENNDWRNYLRMDVETYKW